MSKIAVMGDYDSIYGFASVGLETIPVTLPTEAAEILKRLKDEKYAVIYITEVLASQLEEEIEKMKEEPVPAVILYQSGCWINRQRGAADDQHISLMNRLYRAGDGVLVQRFFIQDDVRFDNAAAGTAGDSFIVSVLEQVVK